MSIFKKTMRALGFSGEDDELESQPYTAENITSLISTGNLIVVLMGNGHFTENGHFLILRGVTLDGKLLIADPASWENTQKQWDTEIIINEAKYGCGNGGPMWSVSIY